MFQSCYHSLGGFDGVLLALEFVAFSCDGFFELVASHDECSPQSVGSESRNSRWQRAHRLLPSPDLMMARRPQAHRLYSALGVLMAYSFGGEMVGSIAIFVVVVKYFCSEVYDGAKERKDW